MRLYSTAAQSGYRQRGQIKLLHFCGVRFDTLIILCFSDAPVKHQVYHKAAYDKSSWFGWLEPPGLEDASRPTLLVTTPEDVLYDPGLLPLSTASCLSVVTRGPDDIRFEEGG